MELKYFRSGNETLGNLDGTKLYNIKKPDLLPLGVKRYYKNKDSVIDIEVWLLQRCIDTDRFNFKLVREIYGLDSISNLDLMLTTGAYSLSDNYFISNNNESRWKECCYYSKSVTNLFCFGGIDNNLDRSIIPSIQFTLGGSYEKAWALYNGYWSIIKRDTSNIFYGSSLAEVLAYKIAKALNFNACRYSYIDGGSATVCMMMNTEYNLETLGSIWLEDELDPYEYKEVRDFLELLGIDLQPYYDMLFLDALLSNIDRHSFNLGVSKSKYCGNIEGLAPIFDNNLSTTGYMWIDGYRTNIGFTRDIMDFLVDTGYDIKSKLELLSYKLPSIIDLVAKSMCIEGRRYILSNIEKYINNSNTLEEHIQEFIGCRMNLMKDYI